jgi:riboflavin kinase / FMN adenylyltransferase
LTKIITLKIYKNLSEFSSQKKTVLTLGTFDGVHGGHFKILEKLVEASNLENYESVLLTFFPHPRMILQQDTTIKLLNSIDEKAYLIEKSGLQNLIIHPFDKDFANLSARAFVEEVLVKQLNIGKIIIGHDHRFGKNRTADIKDLIGFGDEFGFQVQQISAEEINDIAISSTKIRNALSQGDIALANKYLNYSYCISGKVVRGKGIGRGLGFPTANIDTQDHFKMIPKKGVYIVTVEIDYTTVKGMLNIGFNPTMNRDSQSIEVHMINFNKDVYGQNIKVNFLERIRDEQKFDSIALLKDQLAADKRTTMRYFEKYPL